MSGHFDSTASLSSRLSYNRPYDSDGSGVGGGRVRSGFRPHQNTSAVVLSAGGGGYVHTPRRTAGHNHQPVVYGRTYTTNLSSPTGHYRKPPPSLAGPQTTLRVVDTANGIKTRLEAASPRAGPLTRSSSTSSACVALLDTSSVAAVRRKWLAAEESVTRTVCRVASVDSVPCHLVNTSAAPASLGIRDVTTRNGHCVRTMSTGAVHSHTHRTQNGESINSATTNSCRNKEIYEKERPLETTIIQSKNTNVDKANESHIPPVCTGTIETQSERNGFLLASSPAEISTGIISNSGQPPCDPVPNSVSRLCENIPGGKRSVSQNSNQQQDTTGNGRVEESPSECKSDDETSQDDSSRHSQQKHEQTQEERGTTIRTAVQKTAHIAGTKLAPEPAHITCRRNTSNATVNETKVGNNGKISGNAKTVGNSPPSLDCNTTVVDECTVKTSATNTMLLNCEQEICETPRPSLRVAVELVQIQQDSLGQNDSRKNKTSDGSCSASGNSHSTNEKIGKSGEKLTVECSSGNANHSLGKWGISKAKSFSSINELNHAAYDESCMLLVEADKSVGHRNVDKTRDDYCSADADKRKSRPIFSVITEENTDSDVENANKGENITNNTDRTKQNALSGQTKKKTVQKKVKTRLKNCEEAVESCREMQGENKIKPTNKSNKKVVKPKKVDIPARKLSTSTSLPELSAEVKRQVFREQQEREMIEKIAKFRERGQKTKLAIEKLKLDDDPIGYMSKQSNLKFAFMIKQRELMERQREKTATELQNAGQTPVDSTDRVSDNDTTSPQRVQDAKNLDPLGGPRPKFREYSVNHFKFKTVLGTGGFGKVMLANMVETDNYFAVKTLRKSKVKEEDVEDILTERKVLTLATNHPFLCNLFCTFQTQDHLFFVLEFLNGGDLNFHLHRKGRFSHELTKFYAIEITCGLKFLHKKSVIYRDLKLDNILLDHQGHIRLADFGMCQTKIFLDRTADAFCGTVDYMAPEVILGRKYNQSVDWWSFGVILYEMAVGLMPFHGLDEQELFWAIRIDQPYYPKILADDTVDLIKKLLEKDADERLGSASSSVGPVTGHQYFSGTDWTLVENKALKPPFTPQLWDRCDCRYFSRRYTDSRAELTQPECVDDSVTTSDQNTSVHQHTTVTARLEQFNYTNPNLTE